MGETEKKEKCYLKISSHEKYKAEELQNQKSFVKVKTRLWLDISAAVT